MLPAVDDAVGSALAALRGHDLDEDTLVIPISDDGGPTPLPQRRTLTASRVMRTAEAPSATRAPVASKTAAKVPSTNSVPLSTR